MACVAFCKRKICARSCFPNNWWWIISFWARDLSTRFVAENDGHCAVSPCDAIFTRVRLLGCRIWRTVVTVAFQLSVRCGNGTPELDLILDLIHVLCLRCQFWVCFVLVCYWHGDQSWLKMTLHFPKKLLQFSCSPCDVHDLHLII